MVRKSSISIFLISLLLFLPGQLLSLGLGEIEVDSALNQPLDAQINLISARADELEEMRVELAPANVFDRVGVPRPYFLTQLKFKPISLPGGGTAIQVTSKDPVREPFLTFLVEVTWPKGRLLREYTVLLDPPEFAQQRAPQIATPVTTPATQEQVVVAEPVTNTDDLRVIRENMDRELEIADAEIVEEVVEAAPIVEEVVTEEVVTIEPTAEELEETVVETVVTSQPAAEVADDIIIPEDVPGSEEIVTQDAVTEEVIAEEVIAETVSSSDGDIIEAEVISESEVYTQTSTAGEHVVASGDTLFAIAKSASQSSSVSVNQMMLAIQQANPNAFTRNNVNLLKKGAVLRIPDVGEVQSLSTAEARREITNQNALWREYRGTVTQTAATNVDAPELVKEESSTAKQAKQALKDDVKKPAASKQDLNILAAENAKQSDDKTQVAGGEELKKLQNEITLNKELAESKGKEAAELKSRVEALESMLEKKEKILNIQNQQLKDLQQQLSTEADKAAAAEKMLKENAVKEEVKPDVKPEVKPIEKPVAKEIKKPVVEPLPELVDEPVVAEQTLSKPRLEPLPDWDSLPEIEPIKEEVVAEVKPAEVKPEVVKPVEKPAEVKPVETTAPTAETGLMATVMGFVDTLKQHASKAALGLVGLAGLLGLVWWRKKRSYKTVELTGLGDMPLEAGEDGEHFDDILDETIVTPQTNAADAAQVTEDDFDAVEDFGADEEAEFEAASGNASDDAEIGEDVIDEADVYISYGLHQQAQDLLTEAIAKEPDNNEYKVKLAEVYYSQKDQQGFEQYAEKIKDDVGESSSQWQNILAMGKEIAPASALFAGAAAAVGATAKAVLDKPEEADVDIGLQTILDNPLTDANLEDTILDNDADTEDDGLDFNIDDPAVEEDFEDDPVASKIMQANETSDILNFEVDDLSEDEVADDSNSELDAIATGLHETASMNDLTQELEEIGMQTTMNDLKPLDIDEGELDVADPLDDTIAMQSDDLDIDTGLSPADPEATAAYTSSALSDFNADDTEQFDVSNIDTEFLDPAEQTIAQTHTDLEELGPPSLIEEVGTKLDLAKAFVDMGDSDAAKETLIEVINEGDESQIKAAKDLMDKLGS